MNTSDDAPDRDERSCANCGGEPTTEHRLLLDGERPVRIRLCAECYDSCYDELLAADWIEER